MLKLILGCKNTMNKIIEEDIQYILNSDVDFQRFENSTVLITGANGMLASYIVMTLLYLNKFYNYNIKVIAIARNKSNFYKMFNDFIEDKNLIFIELDIININEYIFKDFEIDYIIHTASPSRSDQFLKKPLNVVYPNVFSTDKLLNLSAKKQVKSFLYFSTCDIYGKVDDGHLVENRYGSLDPLDLRSVYGESKRIAETLCKAYNTQYNVPTKIARIAHTYGPTMDLYNDSRVFAEFVKNIVDGGGVVIKSDGRAKRAFCYIVDATIGFLKILLEGKNGEAYNVANNKELISIMELAKLLVNMYPERKINIVAEKQSEVYLENKNVSSLDKLYIDTKKLEKLDWKAKYTIQEGFRRVIDSFLI